jgi:hypothetical protein
MDKDEIKKDKFIKDESKINDFMNFIVDSFRSGYLTIEDDKRHDCRPIRNYIGSILNNSSNKEIYEKIFGEITYKSWDKFVFFENKYSFPKTKYILIPYKINMIDPSDFCFHTLRLYDEIRKFDFDYDTYISKRDSKIINSNKKVELLYKFLNSKVLEKGITKKILEYVFCFSKKIKAGTLLWNHY